MSSLPAYRSTQTYGMLWIILLLTAGCLLPAVAAAGGRESLASAGLLAVLNLGGLLLLGRLVITVDDQAVRWQFGYVGWPAWHIPLREVAGVEPARTTRFGSGIKGSGKHRHFSVAMGSPAVRLHLHDGRSITLGTPEPERLKAFIHRRLPGESR